MRERSIWAAAIVVAGFTGFWLGRGDSPEPATSMVAPTTGTASAPTSAPAPSVGSRATEALSAPLPAQSQAEKRLSASDEAALNERRRASEDVVANALALGRWSDRDIDTLMLASQILPIAEQHELQRRVARAINEDRLKFVTGADP